MVDMGVVTGAVASINASLGILKAATQIRDEVKIANAIASIQAELLTTQTGIFAAHAEQAKLIEEVRTLKEQIAQMKAWEAEKSRYKLTDFGSGTFAYLLKSETANGEPPHRICANCYQKSQKAILQFDYKDGLKRDHFTCHSCGAKQTFGTAEQMRFSAPHGDYY